MPSYQGAAVAREPSAVTGAELLSRGGTFIRIEKGGKAPIQKGFGSQQMQFLPEEERLSASRERSGNIGILCGFNRVQRPDGSWISIAVLDIDRKPALAGRAAQKGGETLAELEGKLGPLPETLTAFTPGYGEHRYFQIPATFGAFSNKILGKGGGIEFQNEGEYVVFPGSEISPAMAERNGWIAGKYRWKDPDADIAPLPKAWLNYLDSKRREKIVSGPVGEMPQPIDTSTDWGRLALEEFIELLKTDEPLGICGRGGRNIAFGLLSEGIRRKLLPVEMVVDLMIEHYNPRLKEAGSRTWEREKLLSRAISARDTSSKPWEDPKELRAWYEWIVKIRSEKPSNDIQTHTAPKQLAPVQDAQTEKLTPTEPAPSLFSWGGWERELPPQEYAIDGILTKGSVNLLVAHGDSLKTWTALSMARSVALGIPWLGRFPVSRGRVGFLDYESGEYEIRRRLKLLGAQALEDRFGYAWANLTLTDPKLWKALEQVDELKLLVIDSLSAGTPGLDENDTSVARPLNYAKIFAVKKGCTIVFIHHQKKGDGDKRELVRGSTAIFAACDRVFRFAPDGPGRTQMIALKTRNGRPPEPVNIQLSDANGISSYETAKREGDMPLEDSIKAYLRTAHEPKGSKEIIVFVNKRRDAVLKALSILIERSEIRKKGHGYVLDSPEERKGRVLRVLKEFSETGDAVTATALQKYAEVKNHHLLELEAQRVIFKMGNAYAIVHT